MKVVKEYAAYLFHDFYDDRGTVVVALFRERTASLTKTAVRRG